MSLRLQMYYKRLCTVLLQKEFDTLLFMAQKYNHPRDWFMTLPQPHLWQNVYCPCILVKDTIWCLVKDTYQTICA